MNLLRILPIVLIVLISGCTAQVSESKTQEEQTPTQGQPTQETSSQPTEGTLQGEVTAPTQQSPSSSPPAASTIETTSLGFNPKILTVKRGDMVAFTNKDTAPHWPASDVHPTHCEYKGCGVFDAKRGLSQGENYSVVFDIAGSWKYHDHLNPGIIGTIVVQ